MTTVLAVLPETPPPSARKRDWVPNIVSRNDFQQREQSPSPTQRVTEGAPSSPWRPRTTIVDGDVPSPLVFDSPQLAVSDDDQPGVEVEDDGASLIEPQPEVKTLSENPFDNEYSRILFEAIDQLQSLGTDQFVDIPQLVIVGSQSCGKSSLLQTLTDIPFPVGSGCCTRFPIRIVSRRTRPGSKNSYRISIDKPSVHVPDLKSALDRAAEYCESGENLTVEEFEKIMDRVAYDEMGIRKGRGEDAINFVANVLKVELSGPNRSHFSIIDLPGIFASDHDTSTKEMKAIKRMVMEYMRMPENIVICVVEAAYDISNQGIFSLAVKQVDKKRLIGVFTKCDIAADQDRIVQLATGKTADTDLTMHNGWFVVRNSPNTSVTPTGNNNAPTTEDELFSSGPWVDINANRRGSKALQTYLGHFLSVRIRDAFPKLEASISSQLASNLSAQKAMGPSRDTLPAQQQFLMTAVQKFQTQVCQSLSRPGLHNGDEDKELRQTIRRANREYDAFMRQFGHSWAFEDAEVDPEDELVGLLVYEGKHRWDEARVRAKQTAEDQRETAQESVFYNAHDDSEDGDGSGMSGIQGLLLAEIEEKMPSFQANQLPGVINPDIYPLMFHSQTQKWNGIAQTHLSGIASAVWTCVESVLADVCPPAADTQILHNGFRELLYGMFMSTRVATEERLREYVEREGAPTLLQTTNPLFAAKLEACRKLRFFKAYVETQRSRDSETAVNGFLKGFELIHSSTVQNMVNDVHDVLKIYYGLALESFIRHVTNTIIEEFVSHKNGPLEGLSTEFVLSLSQAEVERLASEDGLTTAKRAALKADIEKLTLARDVAEKARGRTRLLTIG